MLCRSVSCSQCTPLPLRRLSQPDALSWCCHPLVSLRSASLRVCSLEDVRSERYCVILATLHGRQLTSSEPEVTRQCLVGCQQHAHQSLPWWNASCTRTSHYRGEPASCTLWTWGFEDFSSWFIKQVLHVVLICTWFILSLICDWRLSSPLLVCFESKSYTQLFENTFACWPTEFIFMHLSCVTFIFVYSNRLKQTFTMVCVRFLLLLLFYCKGTESKNQC